MTTIQIPGFVHYSPPLYAGDEPHYSFFSWDATSQGYLAIAPYTMEFELPADWNPVAAEVQALQAKKAAALAEYQKRVADINEQLSKLQALEAA